MPNRISRRRRYLRRLTLSLISLALTLGVVEVVFRAMDIHGEFHTPRRDALILGSQGIRNRLDLGFIPFATVRSTYDSDPRGYFAAGYSIDHTFNSVGWRDIEHTVEKPAGVFRILGLGDSYLYGQGVRFADICLTRLNTLLKESTEPIDVELINAAVNASNTEFQYLLLRHAGIQYDPDLVIVHFVLNDVEQMESLFRPGPKIEFGVEYVATYDQPDGLSEYSHLWSWSRQRWLRAVESRSYIRECLESFQDDNRKWRRCQYALNQIRLLCKQNDIGLLVVVFPFFHELNGDYPFQPIHDAVGAWSEKHDVHVLDLRETYSDYNGPELWVHPTDQHPNEIAHKLASVAIAKYLRDNPELVAIRSKNTERPVVIDRAHPDE